MPLNIPVQHAEMLEKMTTGIGLIDKQHRYLIDTLQLANEKLAGEHKEGLVIDLIHELLCYAIMHFETEEELMQRYGYHEAFPEMARSHRAQHRDFSRQVVAVYEQLREGQNISIADVLKFIDDWLHKHVLGTDKFLSDFLLLAMNESGSSPSQRS